MNEAELLQALSRYHFYHIIKLTDTISTQGYPPYVPLQDLCMKHLKSLDLKGKRVLDIGCRDGLFSFAAEAMGAAEVVGIDNDVSKGAIELLIPFLNSSVQMHQINLYDLKPETFGFFDVIIFPGVLYHLRYPFWGLRAIRDVMKIGGHLLIETALWEGGPNNAMLFCPIDGGPHRGDTSSCTFFNEKGILDTLTSLGFQTVNMELLYPPAAPRVVRSSPLRIRDFAKHPRNSFREARRRLAGAEQRIEDPPPISGANRCVVRSIFSGFDKDTFLGQYWESTHDFHTLHGAG
ncbi:MAG: DUF1698 domain-containing protein [Acidobacteriota bacterium]|nr:DUF1698 domain-containing protein [Acidobacteriota bacterium]